MDKGFLDRIKAKYNIVGFDKQLYNALDTALQVASTDLSVLIQGESGVGKEAIPRIIHDHSPRKTKPYIAINCGSIPEGTIDSELFGHEKGAFTGAVGDHDGYFAAADGGTLFLDEVGELPLSTQVRLLRVLETGEFIRVGGNVPRKTNVRIVAATNVQMQKAIREGKFREDLYFRLCTISIKMPPLRERGDDVIRLFKMFAINTAEKYNIGTPLNLTPEAEQVLMSYKWPGNIRQLRNLAEQMSILCKDNRIVTPEVLQMYDIVPNGSSTEVTPLGTNGGTHFDYDKERTLIFAMLNQLVNDVKVLKDNMVMAQSGDGRFAPGNILEAPHTSLPAVQPDISRVSSVDMDGITPVAHDLHVGDSRRATFVDGTSVHSQYVDAPSHSHYVESAPSHYVESAPSHSHYVESSPSHYMEADAEAELVDEGTDLNLARMEKKAIEEALRRNRNRRKLAAVDLGISERTLYRKIKDYGLEG